MFKKILIANRGEIALRVICACRELGIKTVAVYSEADEHALHVRFADEDVCIGPARSVDSYLNVPAIISAAEITGADAIHPGYGFLSESAYLAEVCEACHIRFIGPDPNVIRLMGDKARARRAMKKAGVPVLPGSDGPVEGEEQALKVAREIGYPVIIKAVGRRRRARHARRPHAGRAGASRSRPRSARPKRRSASATSTSRSTSSRRGTSRFQVLGDHHGNVIHLGERECSIQRRHQKLIEEVAVARARPRSSAARWARTVVDAAQAVQYTNAGTFEFLMDSDGHFYFMEVNTRLQVEHPVTELVTGIDIVKEQIRDRGRPAAGVQAERDQFRGHAIECRDQRRGSRDVRPAPGLIHAFSVPGGPGVRVDTYAHSECTVSPYYDSLIAKIITYGRDRQRSDRAHAPHARDDRRRRHQDDDSAASQDPRRSGLRRRPPEHEPSWSGSSKDKAPGATAGRLARARVRGSTRVLDVERSATSTACGLPLVSCSRLARRRRPADPASRQDVRDRRPPHPGRTDGARWPCRGQCAVHRQRPRGYRVDWRAPTGVHVGQDDLGRRTPRDRRHSTRSSGCPRTPPRRSKRPGRSRSTMSRSGPCSRHTRTPSISAVGLAGVRARPPRAPRDSARGDRRHHARDARGR